MINKMLLVTRRLRSVSEPSKVHTLIIKKALIYNLTRRKQNKEKEYNQDIKTKRTANSFRFGATKDKRLESFHAKVPRSNGTNVKILIIIN